MTEFGSDLDIELTNPAEWLADHDIDTTDYQAVLSHVREGSFLEAVYGAEFLAGQGYEQAIPAILDRYRSRDGVGMSKLSLLQSLGTLGYTAYVDLLVDFATASYAELPEAQSSYLVAARSLFEQQNYTHVDQLVELIQENSQAEEGAGGYLRALEPVFKVPGLREEVIDALIFVLRHYQDSQSRMIVPFYARRFPESERLEQALKEAAQQDSAFMVKTQALAALQSAFASMESVELALRLLQEASTTNEIRHYLGIIYDFQTPHSLYLIKELAEGRAGSLIETEAQQIYKDYWWLYFDPYGEEFDYSVAQTLDSLRVYTEDVASYDWLGDEGFVNELTNRLDNATRHLARGDSANTAKQIANYRQRLEQVAEQPPQGRSPRYVTEDGYQYLSRNARYLLGRLPDHPSENNNGQ